jgi:ABC-type multidrug transport system permease subunit
MNESTILTAVIVALAVAFAAFFFGVVVPDFQVVTFGVR